MKIEGSDPNPDPLVRDMDPRIRIRIHTKMSWIRNTGFSYVWEDSTSIPYTRSCFGWRPKSWRCLGFFLSLLAPFPTFHINVLCSSCFRTLIFHARGCSFLPSSSDHPAVEAYLDCHFYLFHSPRNSSPITNHSCWSSHPWSYSPPLSPASHLPSSGLYHPS